MLKFSCVGGFYLEKKKLTNFQLLSIYQIIIIKF